MSVKNHLTNEIVSQKFENPFALVNFAIKIAQKRIEEGDLGESNLSNEILNNIAEGNDAFEEENFEEVGVL